MKILGICGSQRANSTNGLLLKAARSYTNYQWLDFSLSELPYFDPDLQFSEKLPESVAELRQKASEADYIFVATPEYAHGIPGILKNAFEWMFFEGTQKKKVFVAIGTLEGENTRDQLIEILKTMDFQINSDQVLIIKGIRSKIDQQGHFIDSETEAKFKEFLSFSL